MAESDTATSSPTNNGQGTIKPTGVTERWAINELGRTGLKHFAGTLFEEFLPQLQGTKAVKVYTEMSSNDPVVAASLFAIEMLMREVEWRVEPASDSAKDKEIADFVESCMRDMDDTWSDFIAEVLTMLPYGWSYFEQVYKRRNGPQKIRRYSDNDLHSGNPFPGEDVIAFQQNEKRPAPSKYNDGKIGWRRFGIRSQDSLNRWALSRTGDVIGMWQLAPPDYQLTFIPVEKSLHFRTTAVKNSPEGVSVLRGAYRPWYFKKRLEEIEAIGLERDLAGLPVAYVPPELLASTRSDAAESAFLAIQDIVRKIKRDEQEGVLFPLAYNADGNEMYKLELLSTGGRRQFDTDKIITRYSQQIAMTVLADFILIGHEAVGSFALSSDKTDLFAVAIGAWLGSIEKEINRKAVPQLLELNGMLTDNPPKILPGDIESPDLAALGTYITQLSGAGMPLFPDEVMENHLREIANLPERPEDFDEQIMEHKKEEMQLQQEMMGGGDPNAQFEPDPKAGPAMNRHKQRQFDQQQRDLQNEAQKKTSGKKPSAAVTKAILERVAEIRKHYGPGPHDNGSPQSVHGGGSEKTDESDTSTSGGTWDETDDEAYRRLLNTEGFSVYEPTGQFLELGVDDGYMVALEGFEAVTDRPDLEWVQQYRAINGNRLAQPGVKWGGWAEQQPDGSTLYYMDMSLRFDDEKAALRFGAENNQLAIMDLATGKVIPVKEKAMAKGQPSRFVYVQLDTAMSDEAALSAMQEAAQQGFVEKFLDDNFEVLQGEEASIVAKVNDDGSVTLNAVPSRRDAADMYPEHQVDENVAALQREVTQLRQQGKLIDQTRSMLESLQGQQEEGIRGEYAEAVQQTVDELKELLDEMQQFESEPTVGKRHWWWPWRGE